MFQDITLLEVARVSTHKHKQNKKKGFFFLKKKKNKEH